LATWELVTRKFLVHKRPGMDWMTVMECGQIERALAGADVVKIIVTIRDDSPWLTVDASIFMKPKRKLALWRATGAVHEIDIHGAVFDDPLIPAAWQPVR
jgi:hypothetical protein